MAYEVPALGTAGQVYTAAAHNILVENDILFATFARGVFTNEAARDAAITSPTEGMHAYLTAPTVPTAAGATTAIPIGVQTIYNGTVWVCVTPVGAITEAGGTRASAAVGTLTGGGTNPTVTIVTGATALVTFFCVASNASAGGETLITYSVSGATTFAAGSDDNRAYQQNAAAYASLVGRSFIHTGLTAGTNTFTLSYSASVGTGTFSERSLVVTGIA